MGRVVAISSGDMKTTHNINKYIVNLTGKDKATVLFISTASHDSEGYIAGIHSEFENLGCIVKELTLITKQYTEEEINTLLNQADIIYVGGGDTAMMMEVWRRHKLPEKLKEIYYADQAVLTGISAGAMCWFTCGHSDSAIFSAEGIPSFGWVNDLLDLYHYAFCPHYKERMESFDKMIQGKTIPGIALEDNVAFVDQNSEISCISTDSFSKAYKVSYQNEKVEKVALPVTVI